MIGLDELVAWLDEVMPHPAPSPGDADPAGVWLTSSRPIQRLGLLLEAGPDTDAWTRAEQLDALFLHRPWLLDMATLPEEVGVVAYHRAFDQHLSVGYNVHLARALRLQGVQPLGCDGDTCLGMVGQRPAASWDAVLREVRQQFGGTEAELPPRAAAVKTIAVVGSMNERRVREAANAGADLYLTGQLRQPGRRVADELGIGVVAVGHARAELWGLRMLARLIAERWPELIMRVGEGGAGDACR